jgi:hypothetical protein
VQVGKEVDQEFNFAVIWMYGTLGIDDILSIA